MPRRGQGYCHLGSLAVFVSRDRCLMKDRFIEFDLPLAEISEESARESRRWSGLRNSGSRWSCRKRRTRRAWA
jgi:hypothetical protein